MPYPSNTELPMPVRRHLPVRAQRQFHKGRDGNWAPNAHCGRLAGDGA